MISVIIPAYNERDSIIHMLRECLSSLKNIKKQIILIDDGSRDGTYKMAMEFAEKHEDIIIIKYEKNQGKGYAIKHGFEYATGDIVVFIDADLEIHPAEILKIREFQVKTGADIVSGSKRHSHSRIEFPIIRRILSEAYSSFVWGLFRLPVKDTQVGLKIFKREVLECVIPELKINGYAYDIELLAIAHRMGFSMMEFPIMLYDRNRNRLDMNAILEMLRDTFLIFYRMKIEKYYDRKKHS